MLKKTLFFLLATLIITSCVQPSKTNTSVYSNSRPYQKIGYLVNVRPYPTHTHIGTTALTNFTKIYNFNWQIPAYIEKRVSSKLRELGDVKTVNLRQQGVKPSELNGLIRKNRSGVWSVARGKREIYQKLTKNLGLSSIVIINESSKQAIKDCGMLGCKKFKAVGYGLMTRSFINSNKFISATPLYVNIYRLNPLNSLDSQLSTINRSETMTLVALSQGSVVKPNKIGFVYPKNFNRWTEEEFRPFRAPLLRYIDNMCIKIAEVARNY